MSRRWASYFSLLFRNRRKLHQLVFSVLSDPVCSPAEKKKINKFGLCSWSAGRTEGQTEEQAERENEKRRVPPGIRSHSLLLFTKPIWPSLFCYYFLTRCKRWMDQEPESTPRSIPFHFCYTRRLACAGFQGIVGGMTEREIGVHVWLKISASLIATRGYY